MFGRCPPPRSEIPEPALLLMLIDNVCMLIEHNMYHVLHAVSNKSSKFSVSW